MANILFNYGTDPEEGGWKIFSNDKFEDSVKYSDIPGANPNQAVPSPYARFEVARRAFENLKNGSGNSRDKRTVSNVLDAIQVLFEASSQFEIVRASITTISETLIDSGNRREEQKHLKVYGEALRDYFARESFMHIPADLDNDTLYLFTQGLQPFAITSPTSILLPTPDTDDYRWKSILVEGSYPAFTSERGLIERNKNFVVYLYWIMQAIINRNGGYAPTAIKPMADYLDKEYETLSKKKNYSLFEEIRDIKNHNGDIDVTESYDPITIGGNYVSIYGVELGQIKMSMASDEVSKESDLILKPSRSIDGEAPLVLSSNIPDGLKLKYTSANNFWNSRDSKLPYDDETLKATPIEDRNILPNGIPYPHGYIYDHDFLNDYLIRLPYKFNKEIFFNGNLDQDDLEVGFIPPVSERYFRYFTLDDLKKQMRIKLKKAGDKTTAVEVSLSIPLTSGQSVTLKKIYKETDQEIGRYTQANSENATGMIVEVGMALAYFPNIQFSEEDYNHYIFQLAREENSNPNFDIELEAFKEGNDEESLSLKRAVRNRVNQIDTIKHYSLNKSDFSLLKINLVSNSANNEINTPVSALLIPINFKYYDVNRKRTGLTFGFDFGTSNTHVAVMTNEEENSKELKFELPVKQCVSTISDDVECSEGAVSFKEYQSQLLLPEDNVNRYGFPLPTVISKPNKEYNGDLSEDAEIPFLFASIPFLYGKEDYGVTMNELVRGLKWNINNTNNGRDKYSKSFINELVFLAQVYAVEKDASLSDSEITWAYPISMSSGLKNTLERCWKNAFREYFDPSDNLSGRVMNFTESMAPMVFYKSRYGDDVLGTVVSIDIGGGTSDIVVTPNSEFENSKLASIGLGGDNIFAIEGAKVEDVPMVNKTIAKIKSNIESHKRNKDDKRFNNILSDLDKLKGSSEAEATNMLFGLPLKKELKDFKDDVDFNKLLISMYGSHHIIHYYYASILYYLAQLMKNNPDTFTYAPEKFFFSGSGSKILDIVGKGKQEDLSQFTMDLFWFFLDRYEFPEDTGEFALKMEREEPKEITAKGCIIKDGKTLRDQINAQMGQNNSGTAGKRNLSIVRKKPTDRNASIVMKYKMIPSVDNRNSILTEADLSTNEIQDEIANEVKKFHEAYREFIEIAIENESPFYDKKRLDAFKCDFFDSDLRDLKTKLKKQLQVERINVKDAKKEGEEEYADIPFFLIIKRLIQETMQPSKKNKRQTSGYIKTDN